MVVLALSIATCGRAAERGLAPSPSPIASAGDTAASASLPQPVLQPITRTSPGAQVAWVWTYSQDGKTRSPVGVGPSGGIAARFELPSGGAWRSADGSLIFAVGQDRITSYSAADGKLQRAYDRRSGGIASHAFSPDGRWLALLLTGPAEIQLIDLGSGASDRIPAPHDSNAALPGMSGQIASVVWGTVLFGQDPDRLYALTDWGGPVRLTSFRISSGRLEQVVSAHDGEGGRTFPTCGGPALAGRVIADRTLVTFCWVNGVVWAFDLATLTSLGVVQPEMRNPFWISPIFTPDGRLLYLHQWPSFGDNMQVVDLATRRLLGPVPTPTKVGDPGPFSWLFPVAYAGGTSSTMPVSPDGLKLYSATSDGVMVLRIPDLKPLAKLAPGIGTEEVWISGDGRTVYATTSGGKALLILSEDGSSQRTFTPTDPIGAFISSER